MVVSEIGTNPIGIAAAMSSCSTATRLAKCRAELSCVSAILQNQESTGYVHGYQNRGRQLARDIFTQLGRDARRARATVQAALVPVVDMRSFATLLDRRKAREVPPENLQ
ncbi:hypothetical protein [Ramlibacter sp.]|uniref:hypothetical protein n=1 Tax=Ramlibacter sp. TaxID=1917967 RepID=UPI002BEE1144|nr:hypothetical protein [Ramlibacter sp.]HWI82471.1 hypothetical protein [Ramlibacter sp.]